jgi:hypothetical protein
MSSPAKRADRLAQVRAQVDYHHQRLALYQRLHGSRPSARLSELELAYLSARERLAGASDAEPPGIGASAQAPPH